MLNARPGERASHEEWLLLQHSGGRPSDITSLEKHWERFSETGILLSSFEKSWMRLPGQTQELMDKNPEFREPRNIRQRFLTDPLIL